MARGKPIKDGKSIADFVCDYMHRHHRDISIDTLLTTPADALCMGMWVGVASGRMKSRASKRVARSIDALLKHEPEAMQVINEVCRVALSSRKRGDLKRDKY